MEQNLLYRSCAKTVQIKQAIQDILSVHSVLCLASLLLFACVSWGVYQQIPDAIAHFDHDSFFYDTSARIASGGTVSAHAEQAPIQTVIYPLFVSLLYRVSNNNVAAVVGFQLFLAMMTMLLTYRIACLFFGATTATGALLLCSLNLGFITYSQIVLAEILLTFLLMLFFERWVTATGRRSASVALQSGIALGLSLIVKPIALVVPPVLLVIACFSQTARRFGDLYRIALMSMMSYGFVLLYMVRNYMLYATFALAPMMSLNIYQCYLSKVIGRLEQRSSYEVAQTTLAFKADNAFDETGWVTARTLFWQTVITHPATCAYVWSENVAKTLFGLFSTQFKQLFAGRNDPQHPHSFFWLQGSLASRIYNYVIGGAVRPWIGWVALVEAFWSLIRWFCVLVACLMLWHKRSWVPFWLCTLFILTLAGMTGMDGCCRYRMTFEPILIILTAYGIVCAYQKVQSLLGKRSAH
ncbi:glycosyltransferase family 39 protein [Candidatus Dependentiae bacterium]|nr:glycosyltransferase family 39 protein [Candidatus Dependentiae bacterium]